MTVSIPLPSSSRCLSPEDREENGRQECEHSFEARAMDAAVAAMGADGAVDDTGRHRRGRETSLQDIARLVGQHIDIGSFRENPLDLDHNLIRKAYEPLSRRVDPTLNNTDLSAAGVFRDSHLTVPDFDVRLTDRSGEYQILIFGKRIDVGVCRNAGLCI